MKYLLMIFSHADRPWTGSDEDRAGMADLFAVQAELVASGEYVDGVGLDEAHTALTVRVREGVPVVSDGPFAEAKEQLAGYMLLRCDRERAVEIAARVSRGQDFPVQIQPVMEEEAMRAEAAPPQRPDRSSAR